MKMAVRLALFYGTAFTIVGLIMPFWPVWLEARGLSTEEIGIVLAAGMWAKVAANPVAGWLADHYGQRKRLIVIFGLTSTALYFCYLFTDTFWTILLVAVLFGLTTASIMPLGDNLTLMASSRYQLDYGRIRLWGSVSFIAATYVGGAVLLDADPKWILWSIIASHLVSVTCILGLPDLRPQKLEPGSRLGDIGRLFRNRAFLIFLLCASCLQVSHAVLYGFGTLHWRDAGIGGTMIGLLWAIGVVAEIALFAVSGRAVRRLGPAMLLAIAGLAGVVRWILTAHTTDVSLLVAGQVLHGLTFGAAHLGAMHYLVRSVPQSVSASAQVLYSALPLGIGFGLAMPLSGIAYGRYAGDAFFFMAALSTLGLLLALALRRIAPTGTERK